MSRRDFQYATNKLGPADSVTESNTAVGMGGLMSEPNDRDSVDDAEETEMVGRREAVKRFAKYTAPIMLATLVSTSGPNRAMATCAVSGPC